MEAPLNEFTSSLAPRPTPAFPKNWKPTSFTRSKLLCKIDLEFIAFSKSDPFMTQGTPLALDKINLIRNEFYKVLLELFANYKEFVNKDPYGDTVFDIRLFCQVSKKEYKQFYIDFFFANSDKQDKLSNTLFTNFISQQAVNDKHNLECSIIHF